MSTPEPDRSRATIEGAIACGLLALVAIAFSVSEWADWLMEINEERPSGASPSIVARVLEMAALGALVTATSLGALLLRARPGPDGTGAAVLGGASLALSVALVGLHWSRGWYYHLEHGGPLVAVIMTALQCALLVLAGLRRPRAT